MKYNTSERLRAATHSILERERERDREREREFIGTNIKQFHAKIKLRRWDTQKKPAKHVVSSGAPRKFHKFHITVT